MYLFLKHIIYSQLEKFYSILAPLFLLLTCVSYSQTELKLGDIAFVDYHSDTDDRFTFITFKDLEIGTQITFNENGWLATGGFRTTEGMLLWESTVLIKAGTLIEVNGPGGTFTASTGSIAETGIFALATAGDQIFAYQGTAPTAMDESNFITAIQMNGAWDTDATSSNTSAQPSVFTDGINSISVIPERDNAQYDFSNNLGIIPDLKAAINTGSNWVTNNEIGIINSVVADSTITIVRPGGISKTLGLWVDASNYIFTDAGITSATNTQTVQQWHDLSSEAENFTQIIGAEKPSLSASAFNFNSGVTFTDNFLSRTAVLQSGVSYDNTNYFLVYKDDEQTDFDWVFYEGTASSNGADRFSLSWNDGGADQADADATSANRISFANKTLAPTGTPYLLSALNSTSAIYGTSGTERQVLKVDGLEVVANNTYSTVNGTGGTITMGANQVSGDGGKSPFAGKIGEIFFINEALSSTEISQIESYLGIKYGITLDQSVPSEYLASDGLTRFWAPSLSTGYGNDIAGIARDDNSGLNQKQSKSENADAVLSIGLADLSLTNRDNINSFSTDLSALVWSNNNGDLEGNSGDIGTTVNSEVIQARFSRTWHAQETGTIGTTKIRFDLSTVNGTLGLGDNELNDVRLLVDTDDSFTTGATSISPSSLNNTTDIVEFDHDFVSGTGFFFSLGSVDLTSAPLPVEWGEIISSRVIEGIKIKWNTYSEINNSHFIIYKSIDYHNWTKMDSVEATNSRNGASYHYLDKSPSNQTTYYKVKQVDNNGNYEFSHLVYWIPSDKTKLTFYPNPITNQLQLLNWQETNSWKIYDTHGTLLLSGNEKIILTRNLKTGLYFLKSSDGSSFKFLKE